MDGKPAPSDAHPLGEICKDTIVIIDDKAFQVVTGEATIMSDGGMIGSCELCNIHPESVSDLHDDGCPVFEITAEFIGRWR